MTIVTFPLPEDPFRHASRVSRRNDFPPNGSMLGRLCIHLITGRGLRSMRRLCMEHDLMRGEDRREQSRQGDGFVAFTPVLDRLDHDGLIRLPDVEIVFPFPNDDLKGGVRISERHSDGRRAYIETDFN